MKKTGIILGGLLLATLAYGAEQIHNIPYIKAPQLDGIIQAEEWGNALTGNLAMHESDNPPTNATDYFVGCDKENMYFAFKCHENNIAGMRRIYTHIEERDNTIFTDDCIEIIAEPFGSDTMGNLHFAVNSCGLIFDGYNGDASYQSGIKVACKVEDAFWTVEVLIPMRDLCIVPDGAQTIRMTLGRERHATPPEYTCTGKGSGSFQDHSRMMYFRPMPESGVIPPVTFLGLGAKADPVLKFMNSNADDKNVYCVKMDTFDADGNILRNFKLKSHLGRETKFEYRVIGKVPVVGYNLTVLPENAEGEPLYKCAYHFTEAASATKLVAMPIESPLFEELFSDQYPPQRDFHGMQWIFGAGQAGSMQGFAIQNAIPHSVLDMGREHKDTGMACYANLTMIDWLNDEVFCKRFNTPLAIMPRVLQENVKSGVDYTLIVLPEVRKLWLEDVRTIASNKDVRIMTMADETSCYLEVGMIEEFAKKPDEAQLVAFDAMIKEKYGNGKYGIPASVEEKDPLAWIAYRKALNDELVSLHREASALARSINPDILILSDDPCANEHRLYAFSDWRGICDIVTQQLYPRNNQNVDSFGFLTRCLAHLTNAPEVWPCAHVEEYGASFTAQEVLYKLSATVRNGATGFHYYLNDTTGARSGVKYMIHERWGAPDRYAVELGAQKLLAHMPRLAFPKYDCAMFISADSLRAVPGTMLRRVVNDDIFLHGYLGYGAGVNYRVINELCLENLKDYKYVVTVQSEYVSREAYEALRNYVSEGGTLLVINPAGFSYTPEGAALPKAEFTGITGVGYSENPGKFSYGGNEYPVNAIRCSKLSIAEDAQVIAQFANGDPAMVQMNIGKGKVITMAANPCIEKLASSSDWKKFFLMFSKECGAQTLCDIWRFQLPQSLIPKEEEIPGVCITNNFVQWKSFKPIHANSCEITGSYTLTPEPNYSADVNKGEVSFEKGKLTDRRKAVLGPSAYLGKSIWTEWALGWKNVEEPIVIHSQWSEQKAIATVKLFVTGIARDATLAIAGNEYKFTCPEDFNEDPLSVREVVFKLDQPVPASELDITLATGKDVFILAEMEIWAE